MTPNRDIDGQQPHDAPRYGGTAALCGGGLHRAMKKPRLFAPAAAWAFLSVLAWAPTAWAGYGNRIDMTIQNGDSRPAKFTVTPGNCANLKPETKVLQPGERMKIAFTHDPGSRCDGRSGMFDVRVNDNDRSSYFGFNESGPLWPASTSLSLPGRQFVRVGGGPEGGGEYLWESAPYAPPPPPDAGLLTPRNPIATDAGNWTPNSRAEPLIFANQPGMLGNFYDDCAGIELFHPQHVVRLANKNGRAYFMVAQSRAHNGWISLLETEPGALDPASDLIVPRDGAAVGRYVWQDFYSGERNGLLNPVGNWNHPGKMDVVGGVLIVAAQNWAESAPCFYGAGTSADKVLFYDVRDPQNPRYWGAMTQQQLGVKEISTVGLVRTPNGDYLLTAGGGDTYTTWITRTLSPDIGQWSRNASSVFSGQHGMNFSSFQRSTAGAASPGTERLIYFDSKERRALTFTEFGYDPNIRKLSGTAQWSYPYALPGANRDWDSDSIYVSPNGTTIIYSMRSARHEHGVLFQLRQK